MLDRGGKGAGAGAVDEVVAAAGSTSPGPEGLEGDLGGTEGTEWPWFNDFSVDKAEPSRLFFLLPGGAKVRLGIWMQVCYSPSSDVHKRWAGGMKKRSKANAKE